MKIADCDCDCGCGRPSIDCLWKHKSVSFNDLQQEQKHREEWHGRQKQAEIEKLEDRLACLKNPKLYSRFCTCMVCGGDF